jgi:hypothetical protein
LVDMPSRSAVCCTVSSTGRLGGDFVISWASSASALARPERLVGRGGAPVRSVMNRRRAWLWRSSDVGKAFPVADIQHAAFHGGLHHCWNPPWSRLGPSGARRTVVAEPDSRVPPACLHPDRLATNPRRSCKLTCAASCTARYCGRRVGAVPVSAISQQKKREV